jgi:hypothetical protein
VQVERQQNLRDEAQFVLVDKIVVAAVQFRQVLADISHAGCAFFVNVVGSRWLLVRIDIDIFHSH